MDPSSERAYAERPSATMGQPSERVPDFIPGWFRRRTSPGAPEQIREAVRVEQDTAHFPIAFLREGETVAPAPPGRHGVTIALRDGRGMTLACPPGYWLVRDDDGDLFLWRHDEFRVQFDRQLDRPWCPPIERDAIDEILDEGPPPMAGAEPSEEHAAAISGWRGTQPAEGTRRRLVRDVLEDRGVHPTRALDHADAIEAALLDCEQARYEHAKVEEKCGSGSLEEAAKKIVSRGLEDEEREEELVEQREEARAGEDSFKAQRDAALNLLRWLIGDLIPNAGRRQQEVMDGPDEVGANRDRDPDEDASLASFELSRALTHIRNAFDFWTGH